MHDSFYDCYVTSSDDGNRFLFRLHDRAAELILVEVFDTETKEVSLVCRGIINPSFFSRRSFAAFEDFAVFSPDSTMLLVNEHVGPMLFDLAQKKRLLKFSRNVLWARFSPDGTLFILAVENPCTIQWWTLHGKLIHQFYTEAHSSFDHFCPDGTLVLRTESGAYFLSPFLAIRTGHDWEEIPAPNVAGVVLTGSAADISRKGYFSVRSLCRFALEAFYPIDIFKFLYRPKKEGKKFAAVDKYKLHTIFEPATALLKTLQNKKDMSTGSLGEVVCAVDSCIEQVRQAGGLGLEEWEEAYQ